MDKKQTRLCHEECCLKFTLRLYKVQAYTHTLCVCVRACDYNSTSKHHLIKKSHLSKRIAQVHYILTDILKFRNILLFYLRAYCMVQSPSWEANWFAASQEIPHIFMEPKVSLPHSQASATCPYPGPAQSSPHAHIPPPGDPSQYYPLKYA